MRVYHLAKAVGDYLSIKISGLSIQMEILTQQEPEILRVINTFKSLESTARENLTSHSSHENIRRRGHRRPAVSVQRQEPSRQLPLAQPPPHTGCRADSSLFSLTSSCIFRHLQLLFITAFKQNAKSIQNMQMDTHR